MMTISGMNEPMMQGSSMQAGYSGMNMQTDSVSKNLQNQIANAQKQLQELSSNEDLTVEEKMKKRQEIQQTITSLNQQLRQHQMEQRKEKQTKNADENTVESSSNANSNKTGLSKTSMQAMISADSSMKQARVQGNVATRMEGRAGVLEIEIKQDGSRGASTDKKEAELADVEQKAVNAQASQMTTLADANQTMEEAAKAERGSTDSKTTAKTEDKGSSTDKTDLRKTEPKETSKDTADSTDVETTVQTAAPEAPNPYIPVDIRL